ncbi:MAG: cph2 14 [Moraxellaceae bacterium]|jgi:EAL domain-containing protein (putative c-di-GMP-specific phosphodiesterase class I)/DNA-binding response OmpR family regulator|nr:cph2 14 [Moraxellaceae bacterium]
MFRFMRPAEAALPRLLILDDEAMTGATLQRMVALSGFAARHATNADDFFRLLKEWAPDVVSLDLVMPGMDGIEVIRSLGGQQQKALLIITSGVGSRILEAAERSARAHGLDIVGFLPKPFSAATLRQLLLKTQARLAKRPPVVETASLPERELSVAARQRLVAVRSPAAEPGPSVVDLRTALDRLEIRLAYQPKVDCSTGALVGFEALARWIRPELGHVRPEVFIALAEQHGLIDELTCRVTDLALAWLAGLAREAAACSATVRSSLEQVQLSLNVSALSLGNQALFERMVLRCRQLGIASQRVVLELTETSAMQDAITALDNLTRLRLQGCHLSIDDFGTGYSSMVQLVKLPFSEIKIDKSFVMRATSCEESRAVVRSVVDLGRSLGLSITAEGVEDEATLRYLKELGCDSVQGYWISRALAPDAVIPWLLAHEARRLPH